MKYKKHLKNLADSQAFYANHSNSAMNAGVAKKGHQFTKPGSNNS